jgi:hypothetical protein
LSDGLIHATLRDAILAMWPRRAQQELLLDLGERKGWTGDDYASRVAEVAVWLRDELMLPEPIATGGVASPDSGWRDLREWASQRRHEATSGVARWALELAPAVGTAPKTLANSLRGGLSSARADHRWLSLVARAAREPVREDAWVFHRRTAAGVSSALAAMATHAPYDAADAMLLLSLLALWQRRRPTSDARANRGRLRSRRETPKAVAALRGTLIEAGQIAPLMKLASALPSTGGARAVALVALEAALTEAHLAPHPARLTGEQPVDTGEGLLRAVEAALARHGDLVGHDGDAYAFRIDRMRAWRDRRSQAPPSDRVSDLPYVAASMALEQRETPSPAPDWETTTPGLLMLIPLLRHRGLAR